MRKKYLFLVLAFALLLIPRSAFALICEQSTAFGAGEQCWSEVTVASNETNLVSSGAVLVYDTGNAFQTNTAAAFQVRTATASADGVKIAGIAQRSIVSGQNALILVRGRGDIAIKTTEAITSGNALFVSTSGDSSLVTSTTQTQTAFALQNTTATGNTKSTVKAYITIV